MLTFHAIRPELLQRYRFGLKTADFLFCGSCGVYIGAHIRRAHRAFGIVNALALTVIPPDLPVAVPVDHELESPVERAKRREQRWTPISEPI